MKKLLPYLLTAVVGLGTAWFLFGGEESSGTTTKVNAPAPEGAARAPAQADEPSAAGGEAAEAPTGGSTEPVMRPPNQAELDQKQRQARPFNQRYDRVSGFWRILAKDLAKTAPELAGEAARMDQALRDRSNQPDDMLNVQATVDAELALVEKASAVVGRDPSMAPMLEYIRRTGEAVKRGEDPTTIPRPSSEDPNPFD